MNIRLKKALMELWINPARSALMIVALIIGLWGLGSNLVSYSILSTDLNANYTGSRPYHVVLTATDFDKLDLSSFKTRAEIETAEFRDLSYQRIEVFPNQWIPLWVFGVQNFDNMELAHIYQEQGKRVPDPGTMLIERNGQLVSNLKLSSVARVRVEGKTLAVPISGISFDPAQAPSTQDAFIYAYVDKKTFTEMTGQPGNQRLIIRFRQVNSRQDVQKITQKIVKEFSNDGIIVKTINIPEFGQHPHQFQLNTLIAFQAGIGLIAFIMGAVLVSQPMQAILAQQIRQIGVLKAIGATRSQVFGIYLIMVFILGAIATLIATPVAVASGYAFARFVSTVLNFNIMTTTLPLHNYLALISIGLLLPIVFTISTIRRGINISVTEALSDYGINQHSTPSSAEEFSCLPISNALRLSLRNLFRKKKRMLVTMFMIALGVAIFSAGFNVRQSLIVFLDETKESMKYDVQIVLRNPVAPEKAIAAFESLSNLKYIETWSGGQGRLQTGIISATNGMGVVALPYDSVLMKREIIEGRWLKPNDETEIVINQMAADTLDSPVVGENIVIGLKTKQITARLVGIIKEFDLPKIYIDKHQYDELANPEHLINSLMFAAKDRSYASVVEMKKGIEIRIEKTDLDVLYVMSQTERAKIIYEHLNIILTLFGFLSSIVLVVGALGMASTTGINILERTREIGVMRAIGATPKTIYGLFVAEGMIINGIGIIVGLIASLPLSYLAAKFFGNLILSNDVSLGFAFSTEGFVITLFTIITFGWLASRIPARKAIAVSTREALSYE
jgi:putative ABC transport system permease protein